MKLINSLGFLLIGSVMFFLPQFAPGLCPVSFDGSSIRATWLHVMGLVQLGIGASFMVRKAGTEFAGWLERWPELIAAQTAAPDFDPVPQAGVHGFPDRAVALAGQPMAEVIPVDFKPAWSDQRQVAA